MIPVHSEPFNPAGWQGSLPFRLENGRNETRAHSLVEFSFAIPAADPHWTAAHLRLTAQVDGAWAALPAQFFDLQHAAGACTGKVAFFATFAPHETAEVRLYYGHPDAPPVPYQRQLSVQKGPNGPQHYLIENPYYKIETMPRSGQIWHIWNRLGSNTSWHHNEWDDNKDKGGDPCHWAPNCWVAHPERITNGYDAPDPDSFDWHYVFGWDNPKTVCQDGPVFFEIRRRDVVWPHPEHSSPNLRRDGRVKLIAEVVYRFYDGCPWVYQSSDMTTQEDLLVYFIRNSQFVFLDHVFTHAIIAPERGEVKPTDELDPLVIRLMARDNLKPFAGVQHTLSNVLPAKLDYTSFFHQQSGDGFAQIQLTERNTTLSGAPPTYFNHMIFLTELHNWAVYFCRAFSYTNRRFNPENAVFLPRGQRYEEENICLMYKHTDLETTRAQIDTLGRDRREPIQVVAAPSKT